MKLNRVTSVFAASVCLAALGAPAQAAENGFSIPAGTLRDVLIAFGRQAKRPIIYPADKVRGQTSRGFRGTASPERALDEILKGTRFGWRVNSSGAFAIRYEGAHQGDATGPTGAAVIDAAEEPAAPEIVVTGSNIRGSGSIGAPMVGISAEDIARSGRSSVAEVLRDLPQNFQGGVEGDQLSIGLSRVGNNGANVSAGQGMNLRGLGPLSTLTLVNGRRMPGSGQYAEFVDISNIPAAVLDRIEVVTDGASAIYGSDAVGGVVNLILKKRFTEPVTTLRYGGATRGGARTVQFSQTIGAKWGSGDISLAYEFSRQERIRAEDRDFVYGGDFTPAGGINWRFLNNRFGVQANITGTAAGATAAATFIIPPNSNGVGLTAANLLPAGSNPTSTFDPYAEMDLSPRQERHSAFIAWNQEVGTLSLHADLRYTRRRGHSYNGYATLGFQGAAVRDSSPFFISNPTNLLGLYATRAYRPGLTPEQLINVNYLITERVLQSDYGVDSYGATLEAELPLFGDWRGQAVANYGAEDQFRNSDVARTGANNYDFITIGGNLVQAPNSIDCALMAVPASYAGSDPTKRFCATTGYVAFNPFTSLANNSAAAVDQVIGYQDIKFLSQLWQGMVKADGSLFRLPGGSAKLALGVDLRHEKISADLLFNTASIKPVNVKYNTHSRTVGAVFAEALLPLVGPGNAMPFLRGLDLSFALRHESYFDYVSTTNPKASLRWKPIDDLTLRGTWGTSFHAPGLRDRDTGPAPVGGGNGISMTDRSYSVPCGNTIIPQNVNGAAGTNCTVTSLNVVGGNPDLRPEEAETWSLGFDYRPSFVPGLRIEANYFDVTIKDRITIVSGGDVQIFLNDAVTNPNSLFRDLFVFNPSAAQIAALLADPRYAGQATAIFRQPSDVALVTYATYRNIGGLKETGLDMRVDYVLPTEKAGTFTFAANATKLFSYKIQRSAGQPYVDLRDVYQSALANPVSFRMQGRLAWQGDSLGLSATVNHIGAYRNFTVYAMNAAGTAATLQPGATAPISAWTTVDAQISYRVNAQSGPLAGLSFALSAVNLLDEDPPFVDGGAPGRARSDAYDGNNANGRGRFVSLQIVKKF
ncbi:MAG: TonB-dependent receptor [Nocardioides sp.]